MSHSQSQVEFETRGIHNLLVLFINRSHIGDALNSLFSLKSTSENRPLCSRWYQDCASSW